PRPRAALLPPLGAAVAQGPGAGRRVLRRVRGERAAGLHDASGGAGLLPAAAAARRGPRRARTGAASAAARPAGLRPAGGGGRRAGGPRGGGARGWPARWERTRPPPARR